MKSLKKIMVTMFLLLSVVVCKAQMQNSKTNAVKILGNCGMCKSTIEKAGNIKDVAVVQWDKTTKMASITYDSTKTNSDEILKRIALAGYDSEKILAPDDVYNNLHGCCQYDRELKIENPEKSKSGHDETSKKSKEHKCH